MSKTDDCYSCGNEIDESGYFSWVGPPFGVRKVVNLCTFCGHVIKPIELNGIVRIGTFSGEIYTLSEMLDDGFSNKKRIIESIRSVAKCIGLDVKQTKLKLK